MANVSTDHGTFERGRNRSASRVCSLSVKESYSSSFTASVAQYSHEWLLR